MNYFSGLTQEVLGGKIDLHMHCGVPFSFMHMCIYMHTYSLAFPLVKLKAEPKCGSLR